jgi:hypothetical protein
MSVTQIEAATKGGIRIVNPKSLLAGLFFGAIGLFAAIYATNYPIGHVTRMGPGFFPMMLGVMLVGLGLLNIVHAIAWAKPDRLEKLALKPLLIIPVAIAIFGVLLAKVGLLIAVWTLVLLASTAERGFRKREILAICIVVSGLASLLYVYGLGLPFEMLLPRWR